MQNSSHGKEHRAKFRPVCTIIAQIVDFVNEGGVYSERGKGYNQSNVPVAQWIEHQLPELGVVGSTPIGHTS